MHTVNWLIVRSNALTASGSSDTFEDAMDDVARYATTFGTQTFRAPARLISLRRELSRDDIVIIAKQDGTERHQYILGEIINESLGRTV